MEPDPAQHDQAPKSTAADAQRLKHRTLTDVAVTTYVNPSGTNATIDYYLEFDSIGWVQFASSPNVGLSVIIGQPPEAYSMQELGNVTITSERFEPRFAPFVGQRVTHVELIFLPGAPQPIGLRLLWSDGYLLVFNWGDEIHVMPEWPDYLVVSGATSMPID